MDDIRITSGEYRGRRILSPKSSLTHPMGSREKLALFNMISEKIPGAEALDAYAGSGALGLEALSRGAKSATFIEKNPEIARVIVKNAQSLNISGVEEVNVMDVRKFRTNKTFDIIIADPPYDDFKIEDVEHLTSFLKDDGILVLSHPANISGLEKLKLIKTKKYARACISIYQK